MTRPIARSATAKADAANCPGPHYEGCCSSALETLASRGPLSRLRRYHARPRPLPPCRRRIAQGDGAPDHGLVLERLSRHGPAPGGARRDARGARRGRRRRRRHAQHLRHRRTTTSSSSASSPTCTARRRRCSSPRAMSPTRRRCRRWRGCCRAAVIFSDALNHASMIAGHPQQPRREADLPPQRPRRISTQLLAALEPRRGRSSSRSSPSIRWTATSRRSPRSATSPTATAR